MFSAIPSLAAYASPPSLLLSSLWPVLCDSYSWSITYERTIICAQDSDLIAKNRIFPRKNL